MGGIDIKITFEAWLIEVNQRERKGRKGKREGKGRWIERDHSFSLSSNFLRIW